MGSVLLWNMEPRMPRWLRVMRYSLRRKQSPGLEAVLRGSVFCWDKRACLRPCRQDISAEKRPVEKKKDQLRIGH